MGQNAPMHVRINPDQQAPIKALAKQNNRSLAKEVKTALDEYIEAHCKELRTGPNLSSAPKRTLRGKR